MPSGTTSLKLRLSNQQDPMIKRVHRRPKIERKGGKLAATTLDLSQQADRSIWNEDGRKLHFILKMGRMQ